MTESQKIKFDKKLNEYFEYLKKQLEKEEKNKLMDFWGNKLFYRYIYGKRESNDKSKLPKIHVETLEKKLKEVNITPEEYQKTKGNTIILVELIRKNKNNKTTLIKEEQQEEKQTKTEEVKVIRTLEQLKKIQENNAMELSILRQKHSERYKKFYNISKEEYEKIGQEINKLTEKRKKIGMKIQKMETATTLLIENTPIDEIIKKTGLSKEEIETINITDKTIRETKKQEEIHTTQKKITKTEKKELIVKMLCKNEFLSLNEIRKEFKQKNINTEDLIEIMQELRTEIPGIVKKIKDDGRNFSYSIKVDAIKQMEEYQKMEICPTIYNMDEGTFSFIVRADMHLNMNSTKETIQRIMYPYLNFCTKQNMPIIDLGDIADTRGPFTLKDWENKNKETIKQAYNFYKNYAKAISSAQNIKHYTLFGNHENHPYYAGIDPLEIIYGNSNNFYLLGFAKGEFKIGNDKIGVFHDKTWQNVISSKEEKDKSKRDEYIYEYLCEQMNEIAKNYIYSLIGHYHFGRINPNENFAVINNGIETALMFTAKIENNQIEKMYVEQLSVIDNTIRKSGYQIEIYNKEKKYNK
jgi:hypothetical protein